MVFGDSIIDESSNFEDTVFSDDSKDGLPRIEPYVVVSLVIVQSWRNVNQHTTTFHSSFMQNIVHSSKITIGSFNKYIQKKLPTNFQM